MNRIDLEKRGFVGWVMLLSADTCQQLPARPGVYAVCYDLGRPVTWPAASCGGWYKDKNPTVPIDRLQEEWIDETDIVYFGKTDQTLKKRICAYARYGQGKPVAHHGGRLVWQLPQVDRLLIGWRECPPGVATSEEDALLEEFHSLHARLPFANLRR